MTERNSWKALRERLRPFGKVVRVENVVGPGTPDVCYCLRGVTGWLEMKHANKWPARETTPLVIPSLTLDQVLWMKEWEQAGGTAWLYLTVGPVEFLLTPAQATTIFEKRLTNHLLKNLRLGASNQFGYRPGTTADFVRALRRTTRARSE